MSFQNSVSPDGYIPASNSEASTSTSFPPSEELSRLTNPSKGPKFINIYLDIRSGGMEADERSLAPKAKRLWPIKIRIVQHKGSGGGSSPIWEHPWVCWKISAQQETWILISNPIKDKNQPYIYINLYFFSCKAIFSKDHFESFTTMRGCSPIRTKSKLGRIAHSSSPFWSLIRQQIWLMFHILNSNPLSRICYR